MQGQKSWHFPSFVLLLSPGLARQDGHEIMSWHADEGTSASNGLDTRDALSDAVGEICEDRADGLVIYRLDRLAPDLILQETLLAEIAGLGGQVFSTFAGEQDVITDDPEDPSRRLIRQVLGAVAQYQRSLIRLRLRSDRRGKAERGRHACGSAPPGWRGDEGAPVGPAEATAWTGSLSWLPQAPRRAGSPQR